MMMDPFFTPLAAASVAEAALGGSVAGGGVLLSADLGGIGLLGGAAGGALLASGSSSIISGTLLTNALIGIGASAGLNYLSGVLQSKQGQPLPRNDITIKQALPPRFIDLGRVHSGGALFFYEAPSGTLYIGKIWNCAPAHLIEQVLFDDVLAVVAGPGQNGTVTSGPWNGSVKLESGLGAFDQAASPILLANFSGGMGGDIWSSARRLRGLPYSVSAYFQANKDIIAQIYPNGPPNATATGQWASLPDPRDDAQDMTDAATWAYSDNAALAILRFWLDRDGWGGSVDDVDLDSFYSAANDCDDACATPVAGTEPRYRAWGRYYANEQRKSVLADLLANCAGRLIEGADGKMRLTVGKTPAPTVTLTDADILSISLDRFGDALTRVGNIKPRITSEKFIWQEVEVPIVSLPLPEPDIANETGDLPLKFCPSEYQAQRLGKIELYRRNPEWSGSAVFKLSALRAVGERWINLVIADYAINGVFEIARAAIDFATMTVQIDFQSVNVGAFTFAADDMLELTDVPDNASVDDDITPPTSLAAHDSGASDQLVISWDDEPGFTFSIQYRTHITGQAAEAGWIEAMVGGSGSSVTAPLIPAQYDVRAFKISPRGVVSAAASIGPITIS